jgi:uncharacterized protein
VQAARESRDESLGTRREALPEPNWAPLRERLVERHRALDAAIQARRWFDPWIFDSADLHSVEPDDDPDEDVELGADDNAYDGSDDIPTPVRDAVYPWVAGFIEAMISFDDLLELGDARAQEPQALIAQYLDRDELEDADALWDLVDSFEPPRELGEAVEGLVRASLLLADITRPLSRPTTSRASGPAAKPTATPGKASRPGHFNRGGSRRS